MTTFTTKPSHIVTLVDYPTDGYIAIAIDGDEIAYIDEHGLNIMSGCDPTLGITDEDGYIKIRKV